MSSMESSQNLETAPLLRCPVETLHRIFDYLDYRTILLAVCPVCKRLDQVTQSYDRFVVDDLMGSPSSQKRA